MSVNTMPPPNVASTVPFALYRETAKSEVPPATTSFPSGCSAAARQPVPVPTEPP
jgi:hypothetical protein